MSYPFHTIETKWQQVWEEQQVFATRTEVARPKYYVLDMFPYPSGAGLHVGHPEGYTATDIVARYKRMRGFNVLHPMGWDAFGLPAERHAMQTNIHPAETTESNIANFRRQLKLLGFSYDWKREVNTTHPDYYRWTQWIFLLVYNSYYDSESERARPIEELPIPDAVSQGGPSSIEHYKNERRLAYVANIPVNWCAELGTVLANEEVDEWAGKGYTVERRPMRQWMLRITAYAERLLGDLKHVDWPAGTLELQKNWIGRSDGAEVDFALEDEQGKVLERKLRIFTTRPDTLYGVTYMVVAPEHEAVAMLCSAAQKAEVDEYVRNAALKSELDRQVQGEKAEKTGVFTGGFAVHPLTGDRVPVWIADYVLMSYGTGAIMAVPAHDERDFAFAQTFDLPIRHVVRPKKKPKTDDWQKAAFTGHGVNIASELINDLETNAAIRKIIEHLEREGLGESKVNYKLRDWLFSRQRYWGEPIPISFREDGSMLAADAADLPLLLPESDNFQPSDSGESPLANLPDWVQHSDSQGESLTRETNTMPQWAGSCWYYLRYISPDFAEGPVDPEQERYWMGSEGVDLYVGGAEHAVLHLLYARFWHKVLYDHSYVSSAEPFKKLVHQGLILGEDNRKMSKSLGNVVNPDDVVAQHGADAFRLYEMFMGPLEQMKPWADKGIEGTYRFLAKVWRLYTGRTEDRKTDELSDVSIDPLVTQVEPEDERRRQIERVFHQTVKKVTEDIERLSFNTAISQMMIFVNEVGQEKRIGREMALEFLRLLSPFAPHISEELAQQMGLEESLSYAPWPEYDPAKVAEDEIEVVFQVNGKVRGKARMAPGGADSALEAAALEDEGVRRAMNGKEPRKIIVVKGKLVNVVV